MTEHELSAPHNWCDRCCERCPLADRCPVAEKTRNLDDDPATIVINALRETVSLLEALNAEQGAKLEDVLDKLPDEVPEPTPPPLELQLLERAAADYGHRLAEVEIGLAVLITGKVARIVGELTDPGDDDVVWLADTAPNLLLLERLLETASSAEASSPELALRGQRLRVLLAPLMARVPVETRETLAALTASGRAPSPFVRRPAPTMRPPISRQIDGSGRC